MRQDLTNLKNEIEKLFSTGKWIAFRGMARYREGVTPVFWDADTYPDPKGFLDTATALGVNLVVFHHREFSREEIEEALEKLEMADLGVEEHREYERDIKKLKSYEGFTCTVELSFDHDGKTYVYESVTPWHSRFLDMMDELDAAMDFSGMDEDEDNEPPPSMGGGFYSHN